MNGITRESDRWDYGTDLFLEIDADDGLDRAMALLGGIPVGVQKAVGSAVKRAAEHGATIGARLATERYVIGSGAIKRYLHHFNHDLGGGMAWRFGYWGYRIPLIHYDTDLDSSGRVRTRVLRTSTKEILDHAFISSGLSYNRVRERTGQGRRTRELYGPSAVSTIALNEDKVEIAVQETFDKRIDHEIARALDKYGG